MLLFCQPWVCCSLAIIHATSSISRFQMTLTKRKWNCCPSQSKCPPGKSTGQKHTGSSWDQICLHMPSYYLPSSLQLSPSHTHASEDYSGCQHYCLFLVALRGSVSAINDRQTWLMRQTNDKSKKQGKQGLTEVSWTTPVHAACPR